jgi:protease YdgD
MSLGGTNSCFRRFNNQCDEPMIGMGVCASGTDIADCAPMAIRRNRTNLCTTAMNGICEERALGGNGSCPPLTDTIDCLGRSTIVGMMDYHAGYDDRVRVDSTEAPWRSIGLLALRGGGICTATLVAPDVILTAAHCFFDRDDRPVRDGLFMAGMTGEGPAAQARIINRYVNPAFRIDDDSRTGFMRDGDHEDWAFARLAEPLGTTEGYLPVLVPSPSEQRLAEQGQWYPISQAGYSWDTGDDISAHLGCSIDTFFEDGTILHYCDTTRGDSGSPLLVDRGDGQYAVLAIGSYILRPPGDTFTSQFAVDARGFAEPLNRYIAGRLR